MSKSEVGVVIQYPQPSVFREIEQWRPESAVLIDLNQDLAKHLRANGCEFLVARLHTEPPMGSTLPEAYALGKRYALDYFRNDTVRQKLFDAIQSPVGYVNNSSSKHRHELFASFQLGMLEGIVEFNEGKHSFPWGVPPERKLCLCAMNMFTGHGTSEMLTEHYSDVLNHPDCLLLGIQEYNWPMLNKSTMIWPDMIVNFPNIQVYISELGLTQLVWAGVEGARPGDDGWLFPENNTPFQDVSTPLHKNFPLGSMQWHLSEAQKHPQYFGCAWYLLGPGEERWVSHDVGSLAGEEFEGPIEPEPEPRYTAVIDDLDQKWFTTASQAAEWGNQLWGDDHIVVRKI